jgi:uncharacterized protein involved in exopolysaccharide biosynthesis
MSLPNNTVALTDIIASAKNFIKFIQSKIKLLGLLIVLGGLLGLVYYFITSPKYQATATFIVEEKSSGSGLAGMAGQLGFDISSLTGGNAGLFDGDNILEIIKSRNIIESVLLSKVDIADSANNKTLADLYYETSGLKNKLEGKSNDLANLNFSSIKTGAAHTILQDSVLFIMIEKINKDNLNVQRTNKKGSIISISTNSANPQFSKLFSERLLNETSEMYIKIKVGNLSSNINRLQNKADSLQALLNRTSYQSAALNTFDANEAYKSSAVPEEMSQRDKLVLNTLYAEVVKNVEILRISLINQKPIIQVLDLPKFPLVNQQKSFLIIEFIGILAGLVIGLLYLLLAYTGNNKS